VQKIIFVCIMKYECKLCCHEVGQQLACTSVAQFDLVLLIFFYIQYIVFIWFMPFNTSSFNCFRRWARKRMQIKICHLKGLYNFSVLHTYFWCTV